MAHRLASLAAILLLGAISTSTAPPRRTPALDVQHVSVAGRDVAVWKPLGAPPPNGYPLIVFSHGFTGCNTQTKFLMQALAKAGYLVLAPNHKDAGCLTGRHFGDGGPKPEEPFREAAKWNDQTYRDRREDMEAVLNAVLGNAEFGGVPLDTKRVGLAGHSLGGYTVLGLAGGWVEWKDTRIKAVLALSPYCSPYLIKGQLANLNIPVMYQGGTRDFGATPMVRKRGGAYGRSSKPKYYVELRGAGHFAWTDLNHAYAAPIDAYSVAFFDAYLKGQKDDLAKLLRADRQQAISDLRSAE